MRIFNARRYIKDYPGAEWAVECDGLPLEVMLCMGYVVTSNYGDEDEPFDFAELLDKQRQLDDYIIKSKDLHLDPKQRLTNTILAMMVETAELANEIRCFKHWSTKGPSEKDIVIDEYVDVLHFFLSIANQLGYTARDIQYAYDRKNKINFDRQKEGY